jgi:hypothetical protein
MAPLACVELGTPALAVTVYAVPPVAVPCTHGARVDKNRSRVRYLVTVPA